MRENWIKFRNNMLISPRFQKFAAIFPLTRPIAQARARGLFDVVAGFVYSQILFACIKLNLLELLRKELQSGESIASLCDLPLDSALTLLKAAASLNLTEHLSDGRFALGGDGAALLGNPGISEMVLHHSALYADLADPVALLRRGGGAGALAEYWPYNARDPQAAGRYSALMAASQPLIAQQVLDAYPLSRHRMLLDIGGGEGAFLDSVHARWPALNLILFDLPLVAEGAREKLSSKMDVVAGSFKDDPLPKGADIISLVRVLHDHDDQIAQNLLSKIRDALPHGGTLLIAEPMAETPTAKAMGHGYFGFYLLAMGSGRPRTSSEIQSMLKTAGFSSSREIKTRTPLTCRIIIAHV